MSIGTYGTVYELHCACHRDEGPRYVGQTIHTVESRLARHRVAALRFQREGKRLSASQNWILKHGPGNIRVATLAQAHSREELDELERYWIAELPNLTNHLRGGVDKVAPAGKMSEDQVHEIRALAARFVPPGLISARYAIHYDSVLNIIGRRTWRHLPEREEPIDPDAWIDSILVQLT